MGAAPNIHRAPSERLTLRDALIRYRAEVTPIKRPSTQQRERRCAAVLEKRLGDHTLAAITQDVVAAYRDERLKEVSATSVRLELSLAISTISPSRNGVSLCPSIPCR